MAEHKKDLADPKQSPEDLLIGWDEHWANEIAKGKKAQKDYWALCDKISDIVRDKKALVKDDEDMDGKFNILYANHKITCSAVYQVPPKPDIRRRFMDRDAAAKEGAEILERALSYCSDKYKFDKTMKAAVRDYDLFSRAVVRLIYEPVVAEGHIVNQTVRERVVYRKDFLHEAVRCWEDVGWIAFKHDLTKDKFEALNTRGVEQVDYTNSDDEDAYPDDPSTRKATQFSTTPVWEIWDKNRRTVVWFSESVQKWIGELEDPLGLEEFWPMPEPLYGNMTSDSLEPIPEFKMVQDLAAELDLIQARIAALTKALKLKGLYAKENPEVERLLSAHHLEMIPVEDYYGLADKGGIEGTLMFMPLEELIAALNQLYRNRDEVKQTMYEVTGIGDLLRGVSDPVETATAQRIKGQFGTLRVDGKRRDIEAYARDVIELKSELIAKHFEPQQIALMVNANLADPVEAQKFAIGVEVLKSRFAEYKIDVETDSTIAIDTQAEKESTTELMTGLTSLLTELGPMVAQGQIPLPIALELIRIAIKPFRGARNIETLLDELQTQAEQGEGQPQQPSPEEQLAAVEKQRAEEQLRFLQAKNASDERKFELEEARKLRELQHTELKLALESEILIQKSGLEREKAEAIRSQIDAKTIEAWEKAQGAADKADIDVRKADDLALIEIQKARETANQQRSVN